MSLPLVRILAVALLAQVTTACSTDVMRFSEQPFGNPFASRADTASTGAIAAAPKRINSAALPVPPEYQPLPANVGSTGQIAAATQVAQSSAAGKAVAGWTPVGGSAVTVGSGDTIEALSNRYGVPANALRAANGINSGQPAQGTRVVIPVYKPGVTAQQAQAEPTRVASTAPVATPSRTPRYEAIAPAPKKAEAPKAERKPRYESLDQKPAAKAETPKPAPKAAAKPVSRPVEKAKVDAVKPAPKPQKVAAKSVKAADDEDEEDQPLPPKKQPAPKAPKVAAQTKAAPVPEAKAAPRAEAKPEQVAKAETTASSDQEFRWPARGRVISGYGSKGPNGSNDGINIALPEGTPVKAAEGGTVAYAGDEIKGYGKMVLIRHPNGYVSAYAHNGDLSVKKGDTVKRGQQIARSGQSGNVTSPQLHFELRKGSDPVDPSKYLD